MNLPDWDGDDALAIVVVIAVCDVVEVVVVVVVIVVVVEVVVEVVVVVVCTIIAAGYVPLENGDLPYNLQYVARLLNILSTSLLSNKPDL